MKNELFPGRHKYTGPIKGLFGLLHHDMLFEESHDVMKRVAYVQSKKPQHEKAIRLHNMIYLGGCDVAAKRAPLDADYEAKRVPLDADYEAKCAQLHADYEAKCAPLDADYQAKCAQLDADYEAKCAQLDAEIVAYIRQHIPDCAWNGKELVFTEATS